MLAEILHHPFSAIMVLLSLCNVVLYLCRGHWGMVMYWLAGASITISVTWLRDWGAPEAPTKEKPAHTRSDEWSETEKADGRPKE